MTARQIQIVLNVQTTITHREIITLQLGQCGNQGETISLKGTFIYTMYMKWAPYSGNDYAPQSMASVNKEFSRSGSSVLNITPSSYVLSTEEHVQLYGLYFGLCPEEK